MTIEELKKKMAENQRRLDELKAQQRTSNDLLSVGVIPRRTQGQHGHAYAACSSQPAVRNA